MRLLGFILLGTFLLEACQAVQPSTGCGRDLPSQPHPGHHHRFRIQFHDKHLGVIDRDYILQLPNGFKNDIPTPMIVDFHGYTGSAHYQMDPNGGPWKNFALNNGIVMLWPDGLNDAPHGYRAWNCSSTDPNGPKGIDFTKFSYIFFLIMKLLRYSV